MSNRLTVEEKRRKALRALEDAANKRMRGEITDDAFKIEEAKLRNTKAPHKQLPPS